jgi:hypothetical protein
MRPGYHRIAIGLILFVGWILKSYRALPKTGDTKLRPFRCYLLFSFVYIKVKCICINEILEADCFFVQVECVVGNQQEVPSSHLLIKCFFTLRLNLLNAGWPICVCNIKHLSKCWLEFMHSRQQPLLLPCVYTVCLLAHPNGTQV